MDSSSFEKLQAEYGVTLTISQRKQVQSYLHLLNAWNRRINLTALSKTADQLRFHFFESFWAAERFLEPGTVVADVGSGAGFPGMAVKLYQPSSRVIVIEPNYKKVVFLKEVIRKLALEAEIFEGKAEDYPGWERVDVATIRALKPTQQLLDLFSRHGVQLLVLGSRWLPEFAKQAPILRQEKTPASRNRYATLVKLPARPKLDPRNPA